MPVCLVRIADGVILQPKVHVHPIIGSLSASEFHRLCIGLAFSCAEKNISSSSCLQAAQRDEIVLVLIPVLTQIRPVFVEFKMRSDLILHIP